MFCILHILRLDYEGKTTISTSAPEIFYMRQAVFYIKQGLSDLLGKVSTGYGRNDDGRFFIQQLADGLDPEDERNEPGQDEQVSGDVLIGDIQFCSEEYKQENNGQSQKGNERFHFCDFAVLQKKKFFCYGLCFCSNQLLRRRNRLDPENKGSEGTEDQRVGEKQFAICVERSADDVSKNDSNENDDVKKRFHTGYVLS
jgi:hypothetical protein